MLSEAFTKYKLLTSLESVLSTDVFVIFMVTGRFNPLIFIPYSGILYSWSTISLNVFVTFVSSEPPNSCTDIVYPILAFSLPPLIESKSCMDKPI